MQVFILAGGFATRLWPLTEQRAKPLLPLAGKPLIEHLIEKIPSQLPVTISTNAAFADGFRSWLANIPGKEISLVVEESKTDEQKAGALGALAQWIERMHIDDDLLLLTGDNYIGFSLESFLASYREGTALLAACDLKDEAKASQFGTVILEGERHVTLSLSNGRRAANVMVRQAHHDAFASAVQHVIGFEEKPLHPKTTVVSTGCSILPSKTLPILTAFAKEHPDNVGGIFEEFLRQGLRVDCFLFADPWLDIGSFSSYLDAHRLIVGERILLGNDAQLSDTECRGSVSVGANSRIEHSRLRDCIIFDGCEIIDCDLRDCVIDDRCEIRGIDLQGKMLRKGTKLILT